MPEQYLDAPVQTATMAETPVRKHTTIEADFKALDRFTVGSMSVV
jgi:hypothetical protein